MPQDQRAVPQLDFSGLTCPLPLLKTKLALNKLPSGGRIEIKATDPGSVRDFQVFAEQSQYQLERWWQEGEHYYYQLLKP
ncbi:MAG: sulfurtransferase TusA family protein [Pseudomonadales bacterium]|nr:sulfurtransferase TusA family protein [Pseudomonadales bacterium]